MENSNSYEIDTKMDHTAKQFQYANISNDQMEFSVFCIENVASKLGISRDEAYQLLIKNKNMLDEYVIPNYEMLHTQDKEYIVDDIIDYMKECGALE